MHQLLRYLWALPNTLIALPVVGAALASGARVQLSSGVLEVRGGALVWLLRHCASSIGGASALTMGHVVLALDAESLHRTRRHERVHVCQYERWGPFFLPAYLGAALYLFLTSRDAYHDNPFEREAFLSE
ncbi:MAG TPA: hypothetical protein VLR94_11850 [Acidobacteriota bacterium]|nr:hypothetical protein [Acidobacteriota bacterium]